MQIDWSISIGTIISVIAVVLTMFGMHTSNVRRMERLEMKIETMWEWFLEHQVGNPPPRRPGRDFWNQRSGSEDS